MTIGMETALRNARLDAITTFVGNGAKIRLYSGTRPATGGAITTLLAELTGASPFAGAASGGILTIGTVADDASADNSGTATWGRVFKSDGTTKCFDFSVGTSGADLNLVTNVLVAAAVVSISSFTITEANL